MRPQHGDAVVLCELAEAGIEPGLLAVRLVDTGLEVVDDPAPGDAAEVLEGAPVRYHVVRYGTRLEDEVHAILHAHLIPKCRHADLFNRRGRAWLSRQPVLDDERATIERHIRELDRLAEDLDLLDREIAESSLDDPAVKRLMTITGVNITVAAGLIAAIGDIARFSTPRKLVSYFRFNPRVRKSGLGATHHGRITKIGRSNARAMLVEAAWAAAKAPGPPREEVRGRLSSRQGPNEAARRRF